MSAPAHERMDVLLVEDSPHDEELVLRTFRRYRICDRIFVVRDGAEALEYLRGTGRHRDRPSPSGLRMILLDLKLPLLDGHDVLAEIKTDPDLRRIPVVVFTSAAPEPDRMRGYALGANSYIVKPVEFDLFTAAVRDVAGYWLGLNRAPT
ncbi:MAG TPA: response regulator [Candidatus Dormibacteraeota bacterium]|jgi:two-component system response regulator|nr:response regulator [Candidatus Dormibacteraeota bacterium]